MIRQSKILYILILTLLSSSISIHAMTKARSLSKKVNWPTTSNFVNLSKPNPNNTFANSLSNQTTQNTRTYFTLSKLYDQYGFKPSSKTVINLLAQREYDRLENSSKALVALREILNDQEKTVQQTSALNLLIEDFHQLPINLQTTLLNSIDSSKQARYEITLAITKQINIVDPETLKRIIISLNHNYCPDHIFNILQSALLKIDQIKPEALQALSFGFTSLIYKNSAIILIKNTLKEKDKLTPEKQSILLSIFALISTRDCLNYLYEQNKDNHIRGNRTNKRNNSGYCGDAISKIDAYLSNKKDDSLNDAVKQVSEDDAAANQKTNRNSILAYYDKESTLSTDNVISSIVKRLDGEVSNRKEDNLNHSIEQMGPDDISEAPKAKLVPAQGSEFTSQTMPSEVIEIIDFIKNSDKYTKMGAEIPKGILLVGPPGTGKTSIAKAISHDTKLPFYYECATNFRDQWAGNTEKNIRKLFNKAREAAKANKDHQMSILFIDEIDAFGSRNRTINDSVERQALATLLNEMDGIVKNNSVIVIAATNDPDSLDPALKRPGRFDRIIEIPIPNSENRKKFIEFYLSKINSDINQINIDQLVDKTVGATPADIRYLFNEAAIIAVRNNADKVQQEHIEQAIKLLAIRKIIGRQSILDSK